MSDDDIDKSCWIPDGEPILTQHRIAKGDMNIEYDKDGQHRWAQIHVKNILNYIWHQEVITDQQHHDGCTFEIWRNMHRVATGHQRAVSTGENPESTGLRLNAYGYVCLLKRLPVNDSAQIQNCIDVQANEHTKWVAMRSASAFSALFQRLEIIIAPVIQHIRALEALSDYDREQFHLENLQKYLKGINYEL